MYNYIHYKYIISIYICIMIYFYKYSTATSLWSRVFWGSLARPFELKRSKKYPHSNQSNMFPPVHVLARGTPYLGQKCPGTLLAAMGQGIGLYNFRLVAFQEQSCTKSAHCDCYHICICLSSK